MKTKYQGIAVGLLACSALLTSAFQVSEGQELDNCEVIIRPSRPQVTVKQEAKDASEELFVMLTLDPGVLLTLGDRVGTKWKDIGSAKGELYTMKLTGFASDAVVAVVYDSTGAQFYPASGTTPIGSIGSHVSTEPARPITRVSRGAVGGKKIVQFILTYRGHSTSFTLKDQ